MTNDVFTLRYPKNCQVWRAASKDASRYAIDGVAYRDNGLVATNGRILAFVPCLDENTDAPTGGDGPILTIQTMKDAKRAAGRGEQTGILLNGNAQVIDGPAHELHPATTDWTFPDYKNVVPTDAPAFTVGLNAKLLHELAQAIGSDELQISFHREEIDHGPPDGPAMVRPIVNGDVPEGKTAPWGVIMPISVV